MALFKIFKGLRVNLPVTRNEGYVYLTTDDMKFHIDTSDTERHELNAAKADALALNTEIGSITRPVYFNSDGIPQQVAYKLEKDVPFDAALTDTTYENATASKSGLMSAADKSKLDSLSLEGMSPATHERLGSVKIGDTISVDGEGLIFLTGQNVEDALTYMPVGATTEQLDTAYATIDISGLDINALEGIIVDIIYTEGVKIGTTSATAFRGDYGQIAYNHANAKGATFSGFGTFTSNAQGHITGFTSGGHSINTITIGDTAESPVISLKSTGAVEASSIASRGIVSAVGNITTNANITAVGTITGNKVYGAVWNDYAEYRESDVLEPGRVIVENGDDTLSLAKERLAAGANIISDTFGFAIGETEKAKTPVAVSGRVLAYPFEDRQSFAAGMAVCAGPNGTVSIMTREEIREYPECIIGTVSSIPSYEFWGENNIPVNGRIWIKVR